MRQGEVTDIRVGQVQGRAYGPQGHRSGPTFVLLPGIGMSHRYFRSLRVALETEGETVALDLPGFGATPDPGRGLSVPEYAQFTGEMLDALGIGHCVVVGHSMGTQFAVELALQRPSLVSHLVLIGPVVDAGRRTIVQQGLALARDSLRERPSTNAIVFGDYARCGPRRYLAELDAMMRYPTEEKIGSVQVPILVMRGARDPIVRSRWCRMLTNRAQDARMIEVPRGPHVVQESEPEQVFGAIARFVRAGRELRDERS
ncbi:MAG: alpha/beta hydrolase [Terrimesophilobacter sp.]